MVYLTGPFWDDVIIFIFFCTECTMFTFVKVNQKENSNHMLHPLYSGKIFVFLQMINATNKCYNNTTDIMLGSW